MAKPTQQMIYAAGLTALGFTETLPSPTRKARKFTSTAIPTTYWLGKAGSIRSGANYTTSHVASLQNIATIKRLGEKALAPQPPIDLSTFEI